MGISPKLGSIWGWGSGGAGEPPNTPSPPLPPFPHGLFPIRIALALPFWKDFTGETAPVHETLSVHETPSLNVKEDSEAKETAVTQAQTFKTF